MPKKFWLRPFKVCMMLTRMNSICQIFVLILNWCKFQFAVSWIQYPLCTFIFREHGMQLDLKKTDQFSLLVKILFTFDALGQVCRSINLSNNCLRNLQPLQPLVSKLNLIQTLNLRSNEFRRWEDLDAIKVWLPNESFLWVIWPSDVKANWTRGNPKYRIGKLKIWI